MSSLRLKSSHTWTDFIAALPCPPERRVAARVPNNSNLDRDVDALMQFRRTVDDNLV